MYDIAVRSINTRSERESEIKVRSSGYNILKRNNISRKVGAELRIWKNDGCR